MEVEQFLDQPQFGFFIDGYLPSPSNRKVVELISPTTKKLWKHLVLANAEDTRLAIDAADKAFTEWRKIPSPKRGQILRKVGDLLMEHQERLAWVMAMEMGKPIAQGRGEVAYAAGYFYWFAGEAERIYGQTIPSQFDRKKLLIIYDPVGVCGAITPWNFPLAVPARKIAAAFAAGCTVVAKPSPETPISFLLLAHLCSMAGLPKGVLNVLHGPEEEIGQALLGSPTVRKLSFTGSTQTGRILYAQAANTVKKMTLELGGLAPLLVFDDADREKAAKGTVHSKFRNNGQTCVCPNRVYVQEGIYTSFIAELVKEVKNLRLGNALDPDSDLSDVLHPESEEKVKKHLKDAQEKGAKVELIGKHPFEPAVLSNITSDMLLFQEETFGPVIGIAKFKTVEEGIFFANACEYGLSAYAFTESLTRAQLLMDGLDFGIIGINDGSPSTYQASFGGIKSSGFGREGGPTGIDEYLVEKFVSIRY